VLTRRSRVRLALATLLTGVLTTTGVMLVRGPDVYAAPPVCETTPDSTECSIGDGTTIPGDGNGNNNGGSAGGPATCSWKGKEVDCYIEGAGYFNNNDGCYYRVASPQPAGVPEGLTRYYKSCLDNPGAQSEEDLADPPELVVPDPAEIAANILATIAFPRPEIQLAPAKGGVLGLPVWMRIANDAGWSPVTRSATEAGLTVTVTATPDRAVWNMGDGTTVTCTSRGDAWTGERGKEPSTTCGYPMAGGNATGYQAAGSYTISVSTFWDIAWSTAAEDGVLPAVQSPTSTVGYVVNELQVVNR
jgi:hypothetical protein